MPFLIWEVKALWIHQAGITVSVTARLLLVGVLIPLISCAEQSDGGQAVSKERFSLVRQFEGISFNQPIAMMQAPGSPDVWYVAEQKGRILRITVDNRRTRRALFLDISDRVDSGPNEAGLLGFAFHPNYAANGEVFVSYTRDGDPLVSHVSRFKVSGDGTRLAGDAEQVVLTVAQPYGNHNGGNIVFDSNGYLLIGLGDGGSGGDPHGHGQNRQTLLGALLRINVDKGSPYSIPDDNPWARASGAGRPEIYAIGLRNPWRFSIDRQTGELWLADVGQNRWEEINIIKPGGNYGWNKREGKHCYTADTCLAKGLIEPVAEYSHEFGCSITGGYVYRGQRNPGLHGVYIYGDFCSGLIWGLYPNDKPNGKLNGKDNYRSKLLIKSGLNISSFAEDNAGELFVIDHSQGAIFRLIEQN